MKWRKAVPVLAMSRRLSGIDDAASKSRRNAHLEPDLMVTLKIYPAIDNMRLVLGRGRQARRIVNAISVEEHGFQAVTTRYHRLGETQCTMGCLRAVRRTQQQDGVAHMSLPLDSVINHWHRVYGDTQPAQKNGPA